MHSRLVPPTSARALIFDCDGTLAVTCHAHYSALLPAFAEQGLGLGKDWYLTKIGLSLDAICADYHRDFGVGLDVEAIRRVHARIYPSELHRVRPIGAVVAVAEQYRKNRRIAVASGGDGGIVAQTLACIRAAHLFDIVVTIEQVRHGKPAPDLFLAAAARLQTRPAECHVYEDADEGVAAAMAAGMSVCDVRTVPGLDLRGSAAA